ncbi:MAG: thiamine-phosphate kinase [Porticoccaceae bacterium]|nr:thiamine-phosphate kinase [Porticoccaceae bacterium]
MNQTIDEFSLISNFFKELTGQQDVAVGIGDDAAIINTTKDHQIAVATDTLVASVHFPEDATAEQIATRALCVNLSDMAAMGAIPKWFTLSLCMPKEWVSSEWLQGFSQGLARVADQYNVSLIGGDTTAGPLTISITVLGENPIGQSLCRDGAKPDDIIYVSGTLGDGAAALHQLLNSTLKKNDRLIERFYQPQPQIDLGIGLRAYASACIDISDGLIADLGHLCKASGVTALINSQLLPIHPDIKQAHSGQSRSWALTGGDDYQLCFTVPLNQQADFEYWADSNNFDVNAIGNMIPLDHNQDYLKIDNQKVSITAGGYSHFR